MTGNDDLYEQVDSTTHDNVKTSVPILANVEMSNCVVTAAKLFWVITNPLSPFLRGFVLRDMFSQRIPVNVAKDKVEFIQPFVVTFFMHFAKVAE